MGSLILRIETGTVKDMLTYECIRISLPMLECMTDTDVRQEAEQYVANHVSAKCNIGYKNDIPYQGMPVDVYFTLNSAVLLFTKCVFIDRDELLYYIDNRQFSQRQLELLLRWNIRYKWFVEGIRHIEGSKGYNMEKEGTYEHKTGHREYLSAV